MNSGSCVADLEQWTGLKGADASCRTYCRDTNLRTVKWSTGAVIYAQRKEGGWLQMAQST
jgi:hypothetical protein